VDGTLGLGGHAERILKASAPAGRVIGFEWDEQAAGLAAERLAAFGSRLTIVRTSYAGLTAALQKRGLTPSMACCWISGFRHSSLTGENGDSASRPMRHLTCAWMPGSR